MWIIDQFYDGYFLDGTLYPEVEDIMECLVEKLHLDTKEEVPMLDPDDLHVDLHIREKRNRKNSQIKKEVRLFQQKSADALTLGGNSVSFHILRLLTISDMLNSCKETRLA